MQNEKMITETVYTIEEKFCGQLFKVAIPKLQIASSDQKYQNLNLTTQDIFLFLSGRATLSKNELQNINAIKDWSNKQKYLEWNLLYLINWDIEILFNEKIYNLWTKKNSLVPCFGTIDEQFFVK